MSTHKVSFLGLIFFFLAGIALGGEAIPNWAAPATWSPARSHGLSAMDVTNPLPFIGLAPCRIADTRNAPGPYGAPSLTGGVPRNFTLTGQCGIPGETAAVSLNVTVTNTQGPGFILIYPAGSMQPTVSTLNYVANQTIANAAVVPLGGGAVTVIAGVSGTDLILDTNGYFSSTLGSPNNSFILDNNSTFSTMRLENASTTCLGACGLLATVSHGTAIRGTSTTTGDGVFGTSSDASGAGVHGSLAANVSFSKAVFGEHLSTGSNGVGVWGSHAGGGWGVRGEGLGTTGPDQKGVYGTAASTSDGAVGVHGSALATTGVVYGVEGTSSSTSNNSAGVLGYAPARSTTVAFRRAGVRGESNSDTGVIGFSGPGGTGAAVAGNLVDITGVGTLGGALGDGLAGLGVDFFGGLGGSGMKMFYEPHPTDPEKVIRYASLEGPEAGTYFRGRGQLVRGRAVIDVPESFRIVTDEEGLTAQVTPIGRPTLVSVSQLDLDHIVVEGSRDVEFSYLVQGVRRNYKDFDVMPKSRFFQPRSPEDRMIGSLSDGEKARLIANGTYNADGTVNMETAERLGWVKMWADREERARVAAAANVAAHATMVGEPRAVK